MKFRYTLRARADLEEIYEYLEKQQPTAAHHLKSAIERQIGLLIHFPYMMRPGSASRPSRVTPTRFITRWPGRRCTSSTFGTPGEGRGGANVELAGSSPSITAAAGSCPLGIRR